MAIKGQKLSEETKKKISEAGRGQKTSEETKRKISEAKKGQTPVNKGVPCTEEQKKKISETLKGRIPVNKGVPCTEEHKKKISKSNIGKKAWNKGIPRTWKSPTEFKKGQNMGKDNHQWKEDVSYRNIHRWVERMLGKANKCEKCGSDKIVQWSNNNHKYRRDLKDWTQLCIKCHSEYDKLLRSLKAMNSGDIQNGQS